jgi:hypothetical protein
MTLPRATLFVLGVLLSALLFSPFSLAFEHDRSLILSANTIPNLDMITRAEDSNNWIEVKEPFGIDRLNQPLQIGRVFPKSVFRHGAVGKFGKLTIQIQVNPKTFWEDGSIRFAILSFVIPSLSKYAVERIYFFASDNRNYTKGPSLVESFGSILGLDLSLVVNNNFQSTRAIKLRDVLDTSAQKWIDGPISTTYIAADHSTKRIFDFGDTSARAVRPIFHITIWHSIGAAKVRVVTEAANTNAFEDSSYELTLKQSDTSGGAVLIHVNRFTQHAGSRWTKTVWINHDATHPLSVNHNLQYLTSLKQIPNFDPSIQVSEKAVQSMYSDWKSSDKKPNGSGLWNKSMPDHGGRPEIGIFPNWAMLWLYTGDYRAAEITEGQAGLAAAWPMHFREGSTERHFDEARKIPSAGRIISLHSRPKLMIGKLNNQLQRKDSSIDFKDQISIGKTITNGGWLADGSHQPEPFSIAYLLTGDFWYLEQLQFWAAWSAFLGTPSKAGSGFWSRGPTDTSGGLTGDTRGQAWILRSRALAAIFSTSGSPEKYYFNQLTADAIVIAEGIRGLKPSYPNSEKLWAWGSSVGRVGHYENLGIPELRHWQLGYQHYIPDLPKNKLSRVTHAVPPWQQHYLMLSLSYLSELGFPTTTLLEWTAPFVIAPTTSQATNLLMGQYILPSVVSNSSFINDWQEVTKEFVDPSQLLSFVNDWKNSVDGFPLVASAAAAVVAHFKGGDTAWQWYRKNWIQQRTNPPTLKWAIIPRPV